MSQRPRRSVDSDTADTVTVACKVPQGLILRVFDKVEVPQPVMGGGTRMEKVSQERPERVVINGCSHPQNKAPNAHIVGGFALTYGVPAEFWDLWLSQNKDSTMVRNGLIFAHKQPASTVDHAEDHAQIKSGLERLDPDNLPKGLEKSDEMKKRAA